MTIKADPEESGRKTSFRSLSTKVCVIRSVLLFENIASVIFVSSLSISVNTKLRSIMDVSASSFTVTSLIALATVGASSTGLTFTAIVSSTVRLLDVAR